MPKSKVIKMTGTITESKSVIQMPCGYENTVRSGASDMYVRMHRKGCKICRDSKAAAHITEMQTAGTKSDAFSLEETKKKINSLAEGAGLPLGNMDIDSLIASRLSQARQNAGV